MAIEGLSCWKKMSREVEGSCEDLKDFEDFGGFRGFGGGGGEGVRESR